ncbi:tRNA pseudouridine38-40 synthase [Mobilisporobacter senegalensis]|uniref:tRNA pseudouridine synthase A n=1 Tax=Mobilisporobacter senegalensis TaxID=1329262 RepID=A0A3N1XZI7_9FIRM|nr:tRNA pseudouridine(38-40) synthase TruA [Mobilisporobacter senegalensis]ROR31661.1 tRNA pseudouridine38-40 synthase [Mobilisporobacter senegalensis]
MKRVKLVVGYDGTNYCGWQIQPNGITIEEVLNKKLSELLGEEIKVIGASRTDSGVHALGNVAVFDTNTQIPAEKISYALNQRLPEDITIQNSCEVPLEFHPRYCNSIKTYEYKILNRKFQIPLQRLYSHFVYIPLNISAMEEAARYIVGEHDFKSFCSSRTQVEDTIRTVYSLTISKSDETITIRITGNGFLYNMVRIIVGTLIKVGLGVYPAEHVKEIMEERDRKAAGPKVPGKGLTLVKIDYEDMK